MEEKLDQRLQIMVSRSEMEEIERWRYDNRAPSRSEAVRRMVRAVLDGAVTPAPQDAQPPVAQPAHAAPTSLADRLDRLEAGLASVVRSLAPRRAAPVVVPTPVPAPTPTPALDPEAEAEGLRKLAAFVERNRVPLPADEPRPSVAPEPTIEELQAKALALRAERAKRPDFKPVPTQVVPLPGEGGPGVDLYPLEPLDHLVEGEEGYEPPEETSEDEDEYSNVPW